MTKMWNRRAVVLVGTIIKNDGECDVQWVKYAVPREKDLTEKFPVFQRDLYDVAEPDPVKQAAYQTLRTPRGGGRQRSIDSILDRLQPVLRAR